MVNKKISIIEVYKHAIAVEEKGMHLYKALARITKDKEIKSIFFRLSRAKKAHGEFYSLLLEKNENKRLVKTKLIIDESEEILSEEMKEELVIDKLFNKAIIANDFKTLDNKAKVINKCVSLQKRMIQNYERFLSLVSKREHHLLQDIINEEREHFKDLLQIKSKHALHERRTQSRKKSA